MSLMKDMSPEVREKAIRLGLINEEGEPPQVRSIRLAITLERFGKPRIVPKLNGEWHCYGRRLQGIGGSARDAYLSWLALIDRNTPAAAAERSAFKRLGSWKHGLPNVRFYGA